MTRAEKYQQARAKSIEKWECVVAGTVTKDAPCSLCELTDSCYECPLGVWRIPEQRKFACINLYFEAPDKLSINDPSAIALLQIIRETPETLEELKAEIEAYKARTS